MKVGPISAGLLMYRVRPELQVLLAHPGGPFWEAKDAGAWTIPKGAANPAETLLEAAIREFVEETGFDPTPPYLPLGEIRQKAGKTVHAWAFEGDADPAQMKSNSVRMEWPYRSGQEISFPEIDRCGWFTLEKAVEKLNPAQVKFLHRLGDSLR